MTDSSPERTDPLSLAALVRTLQRRSWFILAVISLCLLVAGVLTSMMSPWYRATATIRLEKPSGEVALFRAERLEGTDPFFLSEQLEVISSELILLPVIAQLDLQRRLASMMRVPGSLTETDAFRLLTRKMLELEPRQSRSVIDIHVLAKAGSDLPAPALAAAIANAIASGYASNRIEFAVAAQREGIERLRQELDAQARLVTERRNAVETLRTGLGLAGVDSELRVTEGDLDNLRQLERTLSNLRLEAIARQTRFERFQQVPPDQRFTLINSEMIPDANLQQILREHLEAEKVFEQLKGRLGEAHPDYIAAQTNLQVLTRQLDSLLDGYRQSLEIAAVEAQARVSALEKEVNRARSVQIAHASTDLRRFEEAVEDLRSEERILSSLRTALRQREIDFQVPLRTIEILNQAHPPASPSKPSLLFNLLLAALFGSLLGLSGAFALEFLETSPRSIEEIESLFGKPVLGVVGKNLSEPLPGHFDEPESEPFRLLCTNLALNGTAPVGRILVVQSSSAGEGKSTNLRHLAAAIAATGEKVLLIDSDLRRPTQHAFFGVPRSPGLADCLSARASFAEICLATAFPQLDFLPCGQSGQRNPSVLLGKPLATLLQDLRPRYGTILLDSPPLLGISDATLLARHADGVLFLVDYRKNPRSKLERARQVLDTIGANLFGIIMNRVPASGDADYTYYTQNYQYYRNRNQEPLAGKAGVDVDPAPERLSGLAPSKPQHR